MTKVFQNNKGQSLIEIIIALAIAGIMIGAATTAIVFNLRKGVDVEITQTANSLRQELVDNIKVLTEANWHSLYDVTKGAQYYVSSTRVFAAGEEILNINGKNFTRYFIVENVKRDGNGDITKGSGTDDPSTQKVTVTIIGEGSRSISVAYHLTRNRNIVFNQTDWSGGSGQTGVTTEANNKFATSNNINYASSTGAIKLEGF